MSDDTFLARTEEFANEEKVPHKMEVRGTVSGIRIVEARDITEAYDKVFLARASDPIIHLMRGQVFDIDGRKIFTMGGADSHDKEYRKPDISWWQEEMPTREEISEAIKNINKHHSKVDYIFTHCASSRVQKHYGDTNELTDFFTGLENINFQHWYFGHYHEDKDFGEKFTCLYQNVVKLW